MSNLIFHNEGWDININMPVQTPRRRVTPFWEADGHSADQ